jgi:hypothetical protein
MDSRFDLLLHMANAYEESDAVEASFLHSGLQAIIHEHLEFENCNGMHYFYRMLRQPRVQWEICENTLHDKFEETEIRNVLLLPENTSLDTTAQLTAAARERFAWSCLWKDRPVPQTLGTSISEDTERRDSFHRITRLVCREPGNPKLQNLPTRVCDLGGFLHRLVLPLWGGESDIPLWASLLKGWTEAWLKYNQTAPVVVLVRFRLSEQRRALILQDCLDKLGVPSAPASEANESECQTYAEYLSAQNKSIQSGISRQMAWINGGARMLPKRWEALERARTKD